MPDTRSAVDWNTAPRDKCISIVHPVFRAVATARNGMIDALAIARATQMS